MILSCHLYMSIDNIYSSIEMAGYINIWYIKNDQSRQKMLKYTSSQKYKIKERQVGASGDPQVECFWELGFWCFLSRFVISFMLSYYNISNIIVKVIIYIVKTMYNFKNI